jgi:hypothetical protein
MCNFTFHKHVQAEIQTESKVNSVNHELYFKPSLNPSLRAFFAKQSRVFESFYEREMRLLTCTAPNARFAMSCYELLSNSNSKSGASVVGKGTLLATPAAIVICQANQAMTEKPVIY